jgi:hypothetical protein
MADPGKVGAFFDQLGKRFKNFGDGIRDIFLGIGDTFDGVGASLKLGFGDIGILLEYIFVFIGSYIGCAVYFLTNLKGCIFYYLIEVIGQLLYLPIRIIVWIFKKVIKVNLQPMLDKFWTLMEKLDRKLYKIVGFHIIHYPRQVRDKCYVCKRLKQQVIKNQGNTVHNDFVAHDGVDANMLTLFKQKIRRLIQGGEEMKAAFAPW